MSERATFSDPTSQMMIRDLENELERLRSSTKAAVQQSWDEVEALQIKCAQHVKATAELEVELKTEQEKTEFWRLRCLEAEEQLNSQEDEYLTIVNRSSSPRRPSKMTSFRKSLTSWPMSTQSSSRLFTSSSTIDSDDDHTIDSTSTTQDETQYEEKKSELEMKIKSRDRAIESLEETVSQHVIAMKNMQAEMQCMAETHRLKEKRVIDSCSQKDGRLEKAIRLLQKRGEVKDSSIRKYKQRSVDYRNYIEELTEELGHLLGIFTGLESRGISLDTPDLSNSLNKSRQLSTAIHDVVSTASPIVSDDFGMDDTESLSDNSSIRTVDSFLS